MSNPSRAILRGFLMLCMEWLCFYPGLFLDDPLPLWLIGCSGFCFAICACLFPYNWQIRRTILHSLYVVSILVLLVLTRGHWALPPAFFGAVVTTLVIALHYLRPSLQNHDEGSPKQDLSQKTDKWLPPTFSKLVIFFAIWFIGLILIGWIPSANTAILLMSWSCLMLFLSKNIWTFLNAPEWLGYTERRSIFVPQKIWKKRFTVAIVSILLWIGLSVVFFRLFV